MIDFQERVRDVTFESDPHPFISSAERTKAHASFLTNFTKGARELEKEMHNSVVAQIQRIWVPPILDSSQIKNNSRQFTDSSMGEVRGKINKLGMCLFKKIGGAWTLTLG